MPRLHPHTVCTFAHVVASSRPKWCLDALELQSTTSQLMCHTTGSFNSTPLITLGRGPFSTYVSTHTVQEVTGELGAVVLAFNRVQWNHDSDRGFMCKQYQRQQILEDYG